MLFYVPVMYVGTRESPQAKCIMRFSALCRHVRVRLLNTRKRRGAVTRECGELTLLRSPVDKDMMARYAFTAFTTDLTPLICLTAPALEDLMMWTIDVDSRAGRNENIAA